MKLLNVLLVGALVTIGGSYLAVAQTQDQLEHSILNRINANAALPVAPWANIQVSARNVTLEGVTTDQQNLQRLIAGLEKMPEVANVRNAVRIAPKADPFVFTAKKENSETRIIAHMPSQNLLDQFKAQFEAQDIQTEFTLASGGPSPRDWRDAIIYSSRLLEHMDQGAVTIQGLNVSFDGRAKDQQSFRDLDLIANAGFPDNLKRGEHQFVAPYVENFKLSAQLDEEQLRFEGFVPSKAAFERLNQTGADVDDVHIASGAPEEFSNQIETLTQQLLDIGAGEFQLLETSASFSGNTNDFAIFDRVTSALQNAKIANLDIEMPLPTADPFTLQLGRSGQELFASGFLPPETSLDDFGTSIKQNELRAANGAPNNFADILTWIANGEGHLVGDWAVELSGTKVVLMGEAATPLNYVELMRHIERAPEGFAVDVSGLALAKVEPYQWSVAKSGEGKVLMAGYVPDREVQNSLLAVFDGKAQDTTLLAAGAPQHFQPMVTLAAQTVNVAYSGEAILDQTGWRTDIVTTDSASKNNILEMFSNKEIQPNQLGLRVAQLPPPEVKPYLFKVIKSAEGEREFTGYVPNEEMLINLADQGILALELARGAPTQFEEFVSLGNSILTRLSTGTFEFDGQNWRLMGAATDFDTKADILAQLSAAEIGEDEWQIEISSPPKEVADYVFSIAKQSEAELVATGFVPSADLRDTWSQDYQWTNNLEVANGAPEEFEARAAIGIKALIQLDKGSLELARGQWTLSGRVKSDQALTDILDILAAESQSFRVDVQVIVPIEELSLSAAKNREGGYSWRGYFENQNIWSIDDNAPQLVGTPLPERQTFHDMISLGMDALAMLNEGEMAFAGGQWTLTGESPDKAVQTAVKLILQNPPMDSWYLAITIPAPITPVVPESETAPAEVIPTEPEPEAEFEAETPPVVTPDETAPIEENADEPVTQVEEEMDADSKDAESGAAEPTVEEVTPQPESQETSTEQPALPLDVQPEFSTRMSKSENGQINIDGQVPDATAKYALELSAGEDAEINVEPSEGAPESFLNDALAIAHALTTLDAGEAQLQDGNWTIRGSVSTFEAKEIATKRLATVSNGNVDIKTPPAHKLCNANLAQLTNANAILFQSGSAFITDGSQQALEQVANQLSYCPNSVVEVEGHTDADGEALINLSLSVQRAETVVNELIKLGVDADKLYAVGFGETLPIADNDSRDGKAQNRRIVFTVRPAVE